LIYFFDPKINPYYYLKVLAQKSFDFVNFMKFKENHAKRNLRYIYINVCLSGKDFSLIKDIRGGQCVHMKNITILCRILGEVQQTGDRALLKDNYR